MSVDMTDNQASASNTTVGFAFTPNFTPPPTTGLAQLRELAEHLNSAVSSLEKVQKFINEVPTRISANEVFGTLRRPPIFAVYGPGVDALRDDPFNRPPTFTPAQRRILRAFKKPRTVAEVAAKLDMTAPNVYDHMAKMKGQFTKFPGHRYQAVNGEVK